MTKAEFIKAVRAINAAYNPPKVMSQQEFFRRNDASPMTQMILAALSKERTSKECDK